MSKVITMNLTTRDIERAIKEIEAYKKEFQQKCSKLIEVLTDTGVEIAKMQVQQLDAVYTGELMNSIEGYFSATTGVGIIKAGATYAIFVEFGTGVVGSQSPHPNPQGWVYDKNQHGESGWVYYNENAGGFRWTKGFKSRPFMYNTAKELEKSCEKIAMEVFGS